MSLGQTGPESNGNKRVFCTPEQEPHHQMQLSVISEMINLLIHLQNNDWSCDGNREKSKECDVTCQRVGTPG